MSLTSSLSPVDQSFADLTNGEHGRCLNIVPVLSGEGINANNQKRQNKTLVKRRNMPGFTSREIQDIRQRISRNKLTRLAKHLNKILAKRKITYIFFFNPFLPPLARPLFLPTAIMKTNFSCAIQAQKESTHTEFKRGGRRKLKYRRYLSILNKNQEKCNKL